jgi:two-component system, NtrC family, response regulator HydG
MLKSFREFKFYQSFRIPVEADDEIRFLLEKEEEIGKAEYVEDAKLLDISSTGFAFTSKSNLSNGIPLNVSIQFKKIHLDLVGTIVRSFHDSDNPGLIIYGVEVDEDKAVYKFLEAYVQSFSGERLKNCLMGPVLKEGYNKVAEGFEMFSLLLALFKDLSSFGNKEGFVENMLEEVVRVMEAQRATIFLINADTNQLEAHAALGVDKSKLKFDYRTGIAGSVFTTGVALNIDTINDKSRFNEDFDKRLGYETKSIICHPIHNRDDKVVGVIEILNKRNKDRFTVEDEKTMKVLSLMFSSIYHGYTPLSEASQIRRFSTPFDRKFALIGKDPHIGSLRSAIIKLKDTDSPVLIHGEQGVGKPLWSNSSS